MSEKNNKKLEGKNINTAIVDENIPSVTLKKVQVTPFLNVRNAPSMNGDIIDRLEDGDIVEIFAVKDNFSKISETENKWVRTDFLFPVY